jgi:hypothetical protein
MITADRSRWQVLWLLAGGLTATAIAIAIAQVTGYSAY